MRHFHSIYGCALLLMVSTVAGCGTPVAAVPLAAPLAAPLLANVKPFPRESFAVPTDNGTVYVLVSGGPRTSRKQLDRDWAAQATTACQGDYLLLSNSTAMRRRGRLHSEVQEGYVQCVSPEAFEQLRQQVARSEK